MILPVCERTLGCIKYMPYNIGSPKTFEVIKVKVVAKHRRPGTVDLLKRSQKFSCQNSVGGCFRVLHWSSIHNIIPITINIVVNILRGQYVIYLCSNTADHTFLLKSFPSLSFWHPIRWWSYYSFPSFFIRYRWSHLWNSAKIISQLWL